MTPVRTLIMGAAGRDFHNFNVYFRDNAAYEVVAFTATQIPNIDGRKYPTELAGKLYPKGISIYPESDLEMLIKKHKVEQVIFAYSDVPHEYVMHKASQVMAAGSDFRLMGPTIDHGEIYQTSSFHLCCANRFRQKPDHPPCFPYPARNGLSCGCHPSSHALWRPGKTGGAAF